MWATTVGGFAADAPPGVDDSLIAIVGGIVVSAIGALGLVLAEWVKGRNARTTPSPPQPTPAPAMGVEIYERTAVLNRRADDNDARDDVQDRRHDRSEDRLDALERWVDHHEPGWRD